LPAPHAPALTGLPKTPPFTASTLPDTDPIFRSRNWSVNAGHPRASEPFYDWNISTIWHRRGNRKQAVHRGRGADPAHWERFACPSCLRQGPGC